MIQITIELAEEQLQVLQQRADKLGISLEELLRGDWIQNHLKAR